MEGTGDAGAAACPICGGTHSPGATCPRLAQTRIIEPPGPTVIDPPPGREVQPSPDPLAGPSRTLLFGDATAPGPSGPAGPAPADPLLGAQVGSFRIARLLGRGGMGTVYLAEHPVIGSRVAVKFLHESLVENPQVVARFYDEARAVNLIGHENIVAIYDLNLLPPNRYYFVMEYLEGSTLAGLARAARLDPAAVLSILLQLTDALQCAHERGVVHRDLKPDNVFLVQRAGRRDFVKLVDFGIAKLRNATSAGPGRTLAGVIVGTPEYMAPEQCDDGTIDARTDVYALGVIAYELFTGRLPFQGRTVTQLLLAHLQQRPAPPSQLEPAISPELEAAILTALEKDPAARFQDMAAFGAALRAAQDELEVRAARGGAAAAPAEPAIEPAPIAIPTIVRPVPATSPVPREAPPEAAAPAPARAPVPPAAPPPPPPPSPVPAPGPDDVRVELLGGTAPRVLVAAEVTRAGLFVRAERDLPPLLGRVELALIHRSLPARLTLAGEVVRHVTPAEAAQWKMSPGFAVQLLDLTPERRAALAGLAGASRSSPAGPPTPAPAHAPAADRLRELEARPSATHYGLLALPPDAEFADVRRAARELRAELERVRAHPEGPDQHARATALLARLDIAQHTLSVPSERLLYDALRGNYLGVGRCVAAGVPKAVIEARRRERLARVPGKEKEAQAHLARAQMARKLGNDAAAAAAFEAALAADPLDLEALDAYVAYRRRLGPA